MAPPRARAHAGSAGAQPQLSLLGRAVAAGRALLLDWGCFGYLAAAVLVLEAVLSCAIVARVPYTEIDWIAYMQEVDGWALHGDTDYVNLRGDTGPLVYPAGFLYVYRGLQLLAGNGGRGAAGVRTVQWVFVGVYLATLALVLYIYKRARIGSPWIVLLLVASKRLHSLYMLRLFNDCVAMLLAYAAIAAVTRRAWVLSCTFFSAALSIKMNALLLAPGLVYLLARNVGVARTVGLGALIVAIQVVLGWPFLSTYPASYLSKAFEMSRVFMYTWTVNLKFLAPDVFVSKGVAVGLLCGHLAALVAFAQWRWGRERTPSGRSGGVVGVVSTVLRHAFGGLATTSKGKGKPGVTSSDGGAYTDSPSFCVWVLATSNFAGIVFARTLHYQFYTWYYHTLPLLLWSVVLARRSWLGAAVRIALLVAIEIPFNVGDASGAATPWSSALLQVAHVTLLVGLLGWGGPAGVEEEEAEAKSSKATSASALKDRAAVAEASEDAQPAPAKVGGLRKRSTSRARRA